jgi:hypothetical protein
MLDSGPLPSRVKSRRRSVSATSKRKILKWVIPLALGGMQYLLVVLEANVQISGCCAVDLMTLPPPANVIAKFVQRGHM